MSGDHVTIYVEYGGGWARMRELGYTPRSDLLNLTAYDGRSMVAFDIHLREVETLEDDLSERGFYCTLQVPQGQSSEPVENTPSGRFPLRPVDVFRLSMQKLGEKIS